MITRERREKQGEVRRREKGGSERGAEIVALGREEVAGEAGEKLGSERMRAMEGDGHSQRRLGPAPIFSFSQRLWPVFLRLSLDPYETRSILRRLRRYHPCLPLSPSDSG